MRYLLIILYLVLLPAHADPAIEFSEFVKAELAKQKVPGASIALIDKGEVRYLNFGRRNAEKANEVTSNDLFHVASISKTVTAWSIMTLVNRGDVSLDEPVARYLNSWELPASEFDNNQVTLRRIMSHTAGLSGSAYQGFPQKVTAPSLVDSLNGIPLESSKVAVTRTPGERYAYSGGGFSVAQLLLEDVTGMNFESYVKENVLSPLGMQATYVAALPNDIDTVKPHNFRGQVIDNYVLVELAAGGLRASAKDMVQFALANMNENQALPVEAVNQLHEIAFQVDSKFAMTLGFEHRDGLLRHGGQNRGWNSWLEFDPDNQNALVILTNSEGGSKVINSIRCKWNSLYAITKLDEYCDDLASAEEDTRNSLYAMSFAILLAALVLIGSFTNGLRNSRMTLAPAPKLALAATCLLAVFGLYQLLGTDLGVFIFAGIRWESAAINYLPSEALPIVMGLALLLLVVALRSAILLVPKKK